MPCVNLCHVENNVSLGPIVYDPRDRGTEGANLAPTLALMHCIKEIQARHSQRAVVSRWGHFTYWRAMKQLEQAPAGSVKAMRASLRARVTDRLLYEGEHADDPQHRILALSKLLASCDTQDKGDKELTVDASTEDAVREELRNPSPRLLELMIDEWCGGGPGSAQFTVRDESEPQTRPPIEALVRALLPHWEDILQAEGWVRAEPCEP